MSARRDAMVVFSPSGKRGRFPLGTPVLQAARQLGVDLDSVCGGRGRCARCQVEAVEGEFARENIVSSAGHLSPPGEAERALRARGRLGDGLRLGCQALIEGDVRIDVPASSQVHQQVVRKDHEARAIAIDPVLRLHFVEVPPPDLHAPSGDLQRLLDTLESEWGLRGLDCDPDLLPTLQAALREGDWQVTVAVRDGSRLVAVWPGLRERVFGAAVDVGSTTLAAQLCDLASGEVVATAGVMNPQIRFGEDLMSRVSYAMLHADGAARMTTAVRGAIDALLQRTVHDAGLAADDVLEVTLVGNPVMHHLLLGLDPAPLGTAPFALATDRPVDLPAARLGLALHPGARAWVLPCIAGHVGADTAGVLLAETPWDRAETSLLIDVGTNAEIVLGNDERLLAASSPTGPAFEGAQISSGQRAAPGAIERVRIDPDTLEPRYRVIGCALWSDEAGFEDALGATGVTGLCGSGIIEAVAGLYLSGALRPDGLFDPDQAARSPRIVPEGRTFAYRLRAGTPDIRVTQEDVRAIQLAKAALYAGVQLLMDRLGIERPDRIRLAGAFGSLIDVRYAMVLGLIPDCPLERVSAAGNAAGTGARIALLNRVLVENYEARFNQLTAGRGCR
ncbi:MAG: ASKHA domain-containing protein [Xanthomonadales bacterium]